MSSLDSEVIDYWRDLHARTQAWAKLWKNTAIQARAGTFWRQQFEVMRRSRDHYLGIYKSMTVERDAALARIAELEDEILGYKYLFASGGGARTPSWFGKMKEQKARIAELEAALRDIATEECLHAHDEDCVCCLDESPVKEWARAALGEKKGGVDADG